MNEPSRVRAILVASGAVPAALATASLALAVRTAIEHDQFHGALSLLGHGVAPAVLGIGMWAAILLRPSLRGRLTAAVAAMAIAVYAAEIGVRALVPQEFPDIAERSKRARAAGIVFDARSQFEVANDLRRGGEIAYPMVSAATVMEPGEGGRLRSAIRVGSREIVPLGGVARVRTMAGNEAGVQRRIESDEMGFNNPPGLWDGAPVDVVLVGDSFTFGWGVAPEDNVAGPLRARFPRTVNLGLTGIGPLAELAALRELGPALRPRIVVMLFFEGNDMSDLAREERSPVLLGYLDPAFRQDLVAQHDAVDRALRAHTDAKLAMLDSFAWRARQVLTLMRVRELAGFEPGLRPVGARWQQPPPAHPDYAMLRRVLHEAKATPEGWGGRLWFVFLPKWGRFSHPDDLPALDKERTIVIGAAKAEGVPVIDGVEVLTADGDPLASFPYRLRGHYSERGYRLIGEAIRDRVSTPGGG